MKFEQLDRRMRIFETAHDHSVLPGVHMVARIDGRSFSHLTRVLQRFDAPYDERFRDHMVATLEHVMGSGFSVLYGYTQSDEMNVLFRLDESTFARKLRKFDSILAGEASAKFSVLLGTPVAFDCRISQLPSVDLVVDYFRWRHEDAHRNALNAHSYWLLRRQGLDDHAATLKLSGVSVAERNELLFQNGINFNELPLWQRRGIGIYWQEGATARRTLVIDRELPMKDAYDAFVRAIVLAQ
jgi:tRNA(His) guanylyltransferase